MDISTGAVARWTAVTPSLAEAWLATRNTHNRRVRPRRVEQLADAMARGDFDPENGATIVFGVTGRLLDGQHRLAAITRAGRSYRMLVVTGVRERAQETMDKGARRRITDTLYLRDEISTTSLASTLRYIWLYRENGHMATNVGRQPDDQQVIGVLDTDPGIRDAVARARNWRLPGLPDTVLAAMYYLARDIDGPDAEGFFTQLSDGVALLPGNPVLAVRNRLLAVSRYRRGEGPRPWERAAWVIKAYNVWRQGGTAYRIQFSPNGREPFPLLGGEGRTAA